MFVKRNRKQSRGTATVPLSWRVWAWCGYVVLALGIFAVFYYMQAHSVQTNQYHPFDPNETASFGFIFAVLGSAIIKFFIVDKILLRVAQKRSAMEIAKEIAKDVAITSVQVVAEGVIDAATGSSSVSSGSSSSGSTKGGEGKFGGGGASGNY